MTKFAYVVMSGAYSGMEVNGVFLDELTADNLVKELNAEYLKKHKSYYKDHQEFWVQEFEIGKITTLYG